MTRPTRLVAAALLAFLAACAGAPVAPSSAAASSFSSQATTRHLLLLHASDSEAELLAHDGVGGVARFTAVARALAMASADPVAFLAAGDLMIPAPALRIELDGKNPVLTGNDLVGFQASAIGNHEFDLGDEFFAKAVSGARFPYLSATLVFSEGPLAALRIEPKGETPWAEESAGHVLPRAKLCAGGRLAPAGTVPRCSGMTVGVVGATTELLRRITASSRGVSVAESRAAFVAAIQAQVDALTNEGVDVVILLSHLQDIRNEMAMVTRDQLTGVDVIVGGGGDDRLVNPGQRLLAGDDAAPVCTGVAGTCYPTVLAAHDGRPVLVVATDGQFRYVGSLRMGFDAAGVLTGFDPARSRPWPVDDRSVAELQARVDPSLTAFEDRVQKTLAPLTAPFASCEVVLDGEREQVRNRETNLGSLSADAMAWAARKARQPGLPEVTFALRNGGGVRDGIGVLDTATGKPRRIQLAMLDVKQALQFDNAIVVVTTSAQALRETFEAALRGAGTARGQFPQVSSEVELVYDAHGSEQVPALKDGLVTGVSSAGGRVWSLTIRPLGHKPIVVVEQGKTVDPDKKITFATLDFLAKGGDGYFPGSAPSLAVLPVLDLPASTPVTEQTSFRGFVEWLDRRGEWNAGHAYPDPQPGKAETFGRIRARTNQ